MQDSEKSDVGPDGGRYRSLIDAYLESVRTRDLEGCVRHYTDDATIRFMSGVFHGRDAIAEWHAARFDAEMEIIRVSNMQIRDSTITVDGAVTSKRLRSWKIPSLAGRMTFRIEDDKIKEATLSPRVGNPLEGWGMAGASHT
jgi:hypothetical protein